MHDRGCRAQHPLATVHDFSSFFIFCERKSARNKFVMSVHSTRSRDRLSGRGEFALKSVKRELFHLYLRELGRAPAARASRDLAHVCVTVKGILGKFSRNHCEVSSQRATRIKRVNRYVKRQNG